MTEISNEYGTALFSLALEVKSEKEYFDCLKVISDNLKAEPDYLEFLSCPSIPIDERVSAIDAAFSSMPEHIVSFMKILCEKGRIGCFEECFEIYGKLLSEHEKRINAKVTSAVELSEDEKASLKEKLEKMSGNKTLIEYTVDKSIIGGLIVEMDGKIMDSSLRKHLKDVKDVIQR